MDQRAAIANKKYTQQFPIGAETPKYEQKIEAKGLTPLPIGNSDALSIGQTTIAIGTPYDLSLAGTMTMGIISGLDRKILIENDLALGKVNYVASDQPIGTILSQSKPEFASVPKSATKIDFPVSGGPDYEPPKVEEETETAEEIPAEGENGDAS